MGYSWHWGVVFSKTTLDALAHGAEDTVILSLLALVIGTALGLVVALVRSARVPVLSQILRVYIDLFRTTPPLVQIIWM